VHRVDDCSVKRRLQVPAGLLERLYRVVDRYRVDLYRVVDRYSVVVLILAVIAGGMLVGGLAQLVLGRAGTRIDWTMALVTGLIGSFIGGFIFSLLAGEGFELRPSGLIGSFIGAVIATVIWLKLDPKKAAETQRDTPRSSN